MNEAPKWDAILFDVDGTLIDSIPFIIESFQYAFRLNLGHPMDEATILAGIGTPLEIAFSHWPPEQAKALMESYLEYNHANLHHGIAVFWQVPAMLEQLQQTGIPLGIVTSKRLSALEPTLEDFDLARFFGLVITKEDTKLHKPNPEPLFEAMKRLNLTRPDRILYVGDSIHDLECAIRAGCQPVMVGWTRMPRQTLRQAYPAIWIEQASELLNLLED
ncbi:MAG: HAD-IA family hydrolase [Eubacteriales bacterium]|nr:HAD-IA family hydrolase [Eubacteriales bacterium]